MESTRRVDTHTTETDNVSSPQAITLTEKVIEDEKSELALALDEVFRLKEIITGKNKLLDNLVSKSTGSIVTLSAKKVYGIAIVEGTYIGEDYNWDELQLGFERLKGATHNLFMRDDQLVPLPIVCDHLKNVKEKVGAVTKVLLYLPKKAIIFEADIFHSVVYELIKRKMIRGISIGCDRTLVPEGGRMVARDISFYEFALTDRPAVKATTVMANGLNKGNIAKLSETKVINEEVRYLEQGKGEGNGYMTGIEELGKATLGVTPNNPSGYGKSDSPWVGPTLGSFTSKSWDDLTAGERRGIASHFAWSRTSPPEKFGDLKLPHHNAKSHAVVWRGVAAAMAALSGARGGVNVPSADKSAIYSHLAAHYREFDKTAPKREQALSDNSALFELYKELEGGEKMEGHEEEKPVTPKTEEKPSEKAPSEAKPVEKPVEEKKPTEEKKGEQPTAKIEIRGPISIVGGEPPESVAPVETPKAEEQPPEEKPAEEKPVEEKKTEEKPSEEKPKEEEKPSEEKPPEEKKEEPPAEKPKEEGQTEEKPTVEEKPTEGEPQTTEETVRVNPKDAVDLLIKAGSS